MEIAEPRAPDLRRRVAARIRALDPRVAILLAGVAGILTWQSGVVGLSIYALALVVLLGILSAPASIEAKVLRSYAVFVAFWLVLKLALDFLRDGIGAAALADAALLGFRLFVLLCVGLILTLLASPRALGLALAWYARPLLGRRAWRVALALSLMVHFLPMAWGVAATARETISRRCPELPWRRRALLLPQTTIRVLSQKTWEQTLAIAARGLDSAPAWSASSRWRAADVGVGVGITAALWALAAI